MSLDVGAEVVLEQDPFSFFVGVLCKLCKLRTMPSICLTRTKMMSKYTANVCEAKQACNIALFRVITTIIPRIIQLLHSYTAIIDEYVIFWQGVVGATAIDTLFFFSPF